MSQLLWLKDGSVIYNCCWSSPAQSFSGQNPAELKTIFYWHRFETSPNWRVGSPYLYPQEQGGPLISPGTGIQLNWPLHRKQLSQQFYCWVTQLSHGPRREHRFRVRPLVRVRNLLLINGCYLQHHYVTRSLHATIYSNRFKWIQDVERMESERSWKQLMGYTTGRSVGHPTLPWKDQ
jgi:hypothetical protein